MFCHFSLAMACYSLCVGSSLVVTNTTLAGSGAFVGWLALIGYTTSGLIASDGSSFTLPKIPQHGKCVSARFRHRCAIGSGRPIGWLWRLLSGLLERRFVNSPTQ